MAIMNIIHALHHPFPRFMMNITIDMMSSAGSVGIFEQENPAFGWINGRMDG